MVRGMADDMNWDDLRYFLAAVRAKTLAGAARTLGVEHTTVGRRISSLERALGAPLVLRGADGVRLTRLGERIAPRLDELERSVRGLRELASVEAMRVRLAVPSGFTRFFTAELPELCRHHPKLSLEIVSGASLVDLSSGDADLAVRTGPVSDKDLVARKLGDVGFSLYASELYTARRGRPTAPDDLRGHELIAFHESLAHVPAARWLEERAGGANVVLRSREMTDMLTAAVDGVGLAVLPCMLAHGEPRLQRLTATVVATRPVWLVHRAEARLSKEVKVVIRFAAEVMKRHASQIGGAPRDSQ